MNTNSFQLKYFSISVQISAYLCITFVLHYLFHLQAYATMAQSDLPQHLSIINKYISSNYYIPHPVFHISVYYLSLITGMHIAEAAPIIMTLSVIATLVIVQKLLCDAFNLLSLVFSGSIMLVIALYVPFFSKYMYVGQYSPNIWHSPTMLLLKPVSLLSFYLFVLSLDRPDRKKRDYLAISSALLLLSTVIKPSFVIVFLPAVFLYVILFRGGGSRQYLRIILFAVPSVLMLAYQYSRTYQSADTASYFHDKIVFTFFGVMKLYSPNIFISTLLVLAFPLTVLIVARSRIVRNPYLILAWLTTVVGFLQAAFLGEQEKFAQGAFGFGYIIALFMLYFFSLKELLSWFLPNNQGISWKAKTPVIIIYCLHLASGIYYFSILLQGGNYF